MSRVAFHGAASPSGQFATTRWTLIQAAGRDGSAESQAALAVLCRQYWYPLYAFVRRRGSTVEEAQDLTQAFFARLLEKQYLRVADPERGRFRTFLLAAFNHFLANEQERKTAQKRGGGRPVLSLDFQAGEQRYLQEPAHEWTPERIFERRWVLTLLDHVLAGLRDEYTAAGKGPLFEHLKGFLTGEPPAQTQAELAETLGLTPGAVKVAIHRLRGRYRDRLREEIAQTVSDPADVDEELRRLFAAVRGSKSSFAP